MQLRRRIALAAVVALSAAIGLAITRDTGRFAPLASPTNAPAHVFVTEQVVAPAAARIAPTWAERQHDAQRSVGSLVGVVPSSLALYILACCVIAAALHFGRSHRGVALLHVRGPPLPELV